MTILLTLAGPGADDAPGTRTGGVPLVPAEFTWPACAACNGAMRFIGQVEHDEALLSIFMCDNEPGMCDSWTPASGASKACLFDRAGLTATTVPESGVTRLDATYQITRTTLSVEDYFEAREQWSQSASRPETDVLGKLGGAPDWIQDDETPPCPSCANPMTFVAELEEGPDFTTAINFGGGCGYAFACVPCREAAFCWQR